MKNFRIISITVGLLGLSLFIYSVHAAKELHRPPPASLQSQIQAQQSKLQHIEAQPRPKVAGAKDRVHKDIEEYTKYAQDVMKEDPLRPHQIKAKDAADKLAREKAEQSAKEKAEQDRLAAMKKKQADEIEIDITEKPKFKVGLSEEEIFERMRRKQKEDQSAELKSVEELGVVKKTLADDEKVTTLSKPFIKEGPERYLEEKEGMSKAKKAAIAGTAVVGTGLTAAGIAAAGLITTGGAAAALAGAGGEGSIVAVETAETGVSLGDDIAGSSIGFEEL